MDENHDGKISQSEFVEVSTLVSTVWVLNITNTELQACMAQRKFSTMLTLKIIDVFIADDHHATSEKAK